MNKTEENENEKENRKPKPDLKLNENGIENTNDDSHINLQVKELFLYAVLRLLFAHG